MLGVNDDNLPEIAKKACVLSKPATVWQLLDRKWLGIGAEEFYREMVRMIGWRNLPEMLPSHWSVDPAVSPTDAPEQLEKNWFLAHIPFFR